MSRFSLTKCSLNYASNEVKIELTVLILLVDDTAEGGVLSLPLISTTSDCKILNEDEQSNKKLASLMR